MFRLTISKRKDCVYEKRISNSTFKNLVKITFEEKNSPLKKEGLLIGFNQDSDLVVLKYQLEITSENNEIYKELRLIKLSTKDIEVQNRNWSRNANIIKGFYSNDLFIVDRYEYYYYKFNQDILETSEFKKNLIQKFTKNEESQNYIRKIDLNGEDRQMKVANDQNIIHYTSKGNFVIFNLLNFNHPENSEVKKLRELSPSEKISLLNFSDDYKYLIVVTTRETKISRLLIYEYNIDEIETFKLKYIHQNVHQTKLFYNRIFCSSKMSKDGFYYLICYCENDKTFPQTKISLIFNDQELRILGNTHDKLINGWLSEIIVDGQENNSCVEFSFLGKNSLSKIKIHKNH